MKTCLIGHVAKSTGATFCIPKTISLNRPSIDRITTMALSLLAPTTTSFTTYPWVPKRGAEWEAKPWSSNEISDQAGLETLAKKLNPVVGYWGERFPSSHRIRKVLLLTLSMLS